MRRIFLGAAALVVVLAAAFFGLAPGMVERSMNKVAPIALDAPSERALALHRRLTIADLHSDTLMWKRDLLAHSGRGHMDAPRLNEGHVALQVFSSVTKTPKGQNYDANSADGDNITLLTIAQLQPPRTWNSLLERSLWHAAKLDSAVQRSQGAVVKVTTAADVRNLLAARGRGDDVLGALLSVEGLHNLESRRESLSVLFDAGYRMAGLTHFFDNELAGSMHGEAKGGLTPLGREIVQDMEAKGMVVDIAHASHAAVAEILAMATKPVVSSHGGVQAVCKVNRNLTDDEIEGVARTGGVVGIGYWDGALCSTSPAKFAESIAHVRDLVGIDHVGLGSDFDGATTTAFDTSGLAVITQALLDRGFTDDEIGKVMGGNVMRVLMQTLPPGAPAAQ
ncbi:MAG: dipeptidase [Alphaproteobacteria bacterium]|nr:dipeptidase [Alphaproteobacteria bacterium]